jgi:SAM-dependent methyltransferase
MDYGKIHNKQILMSRQAMQFTLTVAPRLTYKHTMHFKKVGFLWLLGLIFLLAHGCGSSVAVWTDGEVPFVRSTPEVIDRMLEMARVKSGDVIYDIGSGDGAIIIRAAKKYGVRGVGIEIDRELVAKARQNAIREKVEHLVEFRAEDAFTVDVSPATVVTLYMLPEFNAKLRPILDRQLRPGSRVVSHDYPVEGWVPDQTDTVKGTFVHDHQVLLFELR